MTRISEIETKARALKKEVDSHQGVDTGLNLVLDLIADLAHELINHTHGYLGTTENYTQGVHHYKGTTTPPNAEEVG